MGCFTACFRTWNHHKKALKPKACDEETPLKKNQHLSPSHEIEEAVKLLTAKSQDEEKTVMPISEAVCTNEEQHHENIRVTFDEGHKNGLECNLVKNENETVERDNETAENEGSDLTASSPIAHPPNHNEADVVEVNLVKNDNEKVEKQREIEQNNKGLLGKVESCSLDCLVESITEQKASPYRSCCDENSIPKDSEEYKYYDHFKANVNGKICDCGSMQEEESSESLFSLSIDSRKQVSSAEMGEKEVSSPLKPLQSVLNFVENHSQKVSVKEKTTNITSMNHQDEEKENIYLGEELGVKKQSDNEAAVETSLSSWLVESEKSYQSESSPSSVGNSSDRPKSLKSSANWPVLGTLTSEGFNESLSHQRTRSHESAEVPGIGTIGSYRRHTWSAANVE